MHIGLATTIDRQGLATRWIIHGSASHQRFSLDDVLTILCVAV